MNRKKYRNSCMFCLKSPHTNPGISLHSFPTDLQQRLQWLNACGFSEEDFKKSRRLCSLHFEKSCFKIGTLRTFLKRGSIPTKFSKKTKFFFQSRPAFKTLNTNSNTTTQDIQSDPVSLDVSTHTKDVPKNKCDTVINSSDIQREIRSIIHDHNYFDIQDIITVKQENSASSNITYNKATPKRKRRKYYVGDIDSTDLCNLQKARRYFAKAKCQIITKNKKIKVLNRKISRLKTKVASMAALLAHLKKKNLITKEAYDSFLVKKKTK